MKQIVRWALVSSSAFYLAAGTSAVAQTRPFDIPAQAVQSAVGVLGRQANIQIIAAHKVVNTRQANAVRGSMTVEQALDTLLRGTGLTYQRVGPQTFSVVEVQRAVSFEQAGKMPGFAGQGTPPAAGALPDAQAAPPAEELPAETSEDVVVTGIRQSLERAAEIKQSAVQVVDSIVAQDIGKFPDPTTAAALQRVPGVQVSVDRNNELSGVRIRGLTDILTTVDGREVFTANDRNFDLQDLPAEALARVDVLKSQTADLVEGGVAGAIDLKLNKPFSFRKPTVVLTARDNYGLNVKKFNPQFGILVADSAETGIGKVGALIDFTYSHSNTVRTNTQITDRQASFGAPISSTSAPGFFLPAIAQNIISFGEFTRKQANAALQWQITPSIEAYANGLWTDLHNTVSTEEFNVQAFNVTAAPLPVTQVSNIVGNDHCLTVRSAANGQNPGITNSVVNGRVVPVLGSIGNVLNGNTQTPVTLCDVDSLTYTNAVANQLSSSQVLDQNNKQIAGGLRFDQDRAKANLDIAYQTSITNLEVVGQAVAQRVPRIDIVTNDRNGASFTIPNTTLLRTDALTLRNQLAQNFFLSKGSLFQSRLDSEYEVGGLLSKIQAGLRYADRQATARQFNTPTANLYGNVGTATEANARTYTSLGLPANFVALSPVAPRLNGGARFYATNPEFLRSEEGRAALRAVYRLPLGRPAYNPLRQFDITEKTYAAYGQLSYDVPIAGPVSIDGVVGVRATRTDRTLDGFRFLGVPFHSVRSDTDILPNATARLKLPWNFQSRFSYSKTIRRPDFAQLNPAQTLTRSNNPGILSTGSSGNPDLLTQKANSLDATLEYYAKSGFLSVAAYHRNLKNRVITSPQQQTIDGVVYAISSPRNVGAATLKGLEVSGQYFFDFLPGALSGIGTSGSFTYADSTIKGNDPLAGLPLLGVSKYNYTAGLVYDKFGFSGRLVYTFRSSYGFGDLTAQTQLRQYDTSRPVTDAYAPPLLEIARPNGRLDFGIGYDINDALRLDIGGVNILRSETKTYRGEKFFTGAVFEDETTYSAGLRYRF